MPAVAMMRFSALLIVLGVAIASHGAAAQPAPQPALTLLVATNGSVPCQGGVVTITVAVDNPGDTAVPVLFPSGQRFDLAVYSDSGEVWRWSAQRNFIDEEAEVLFPPGLTLLGRPTWDGRDANGVSIGPGSYRLRGFLSAAPITSNLVVLERESAGC